MYGASVLQIRRKRVQAKGNRHFVRRFQPTQFSQVSQAIEVSANAETAIAGKFPLGILDRKAREFDRQSSATIDRPVHREPAPGVARGDRIEHAPLCVEPEVFGDLAPWAAQARRGLWTDQAGELLVAEREAGVGIHPPGKAQRVWPWQFRSAFDFRWRLRCRR